MTLCLVMCLWLLTPKGQATKEKKNRQIEHYQNSHITKDAIKSEKTPYKMGENIYKSNI